MEQAVTGGGVRGETRFALQLEHLHPDRGLRAEEITRDALAFVMAMDGHHDARFVLQMVARPGEVADSSGSLDVHLICTVAGSDGEDPDLDRVAELSDDLLDVLAAPPVRWSFVPVMEETQLTAILEPLTTTHLAEIARREEPCSPIRWTGQPGFATTDPGPRLDRSLWSMWTLGPPTHDLRRLASVLLAQESPVCVRVLLHPTSLTDHERDGVERLLMSATSMIPDTGLLRASLSTLEALLYLRPVFEVRCLVASPDPISRSMLSALGHAISEPSHHGRTESGQLEGGFAVIRAGVDVEAAVLRDSFNGMQLGLPLPGLAPEGLGRLRRLLGPREAANVFRFPVTDDDFPGITSLSTPELPPPLVLPKDGHRLGRLVAHGKRPVLLDREERFRHLYVSGQTGTGKSTLLLNLALQDIASGAGVAVLDPHGDLVEAILRNVPEERVDDVVLVDPADAVAVVGVNLLEAETAVQEQYIVAELANMFYELFDRNRQGIIGPRFETMLRQAALLLLAHPEQPSSLLDISTLFVDAAVTRHLVSDLDDPILAEFWQGEMQMERAREWQEVVAWFRSKFEIFRTSKLVRNVVGQAESTISFSDILNDRRILLVNLSKGLLGEYNSSLIGHIAFTRLWSAALERAGLDARDRTDFFVYIDEFQNMTSESLPDVLSEARKFRMGITLANQFFSQVPERTRDAIMGNVGNRVTFRLGPKDAGLFAEWLGRDVHADDLIALPNYVGIASLSDAGVPLDPMVLRTESPADTNDSQRAERPRERSRELWARPVEELDQAFFARWRHVPGSMASKVAGQMPPPPRQASFLDEWLEKRQRARRVTVAIEGDPGNNTLRIIKLLRDAVPSLNIAEGRSLTDRMRGGVEVSGVYPDAVEPLVDALMDLGLNARVIDPDR